MTIGERIKKCRIDKKMTQEELASAAHTTKQTIYKYEQGIITNIPWDKFENIAAALETSAAYLMGWEDASPSLPQNVFPLPAEREYPFLGKIACGKPILAEENISEYISLPEVKGADFVMQCKGDSMIDARINDGDIVFIRAQEAVENGEIAAVAIDGEITLKRVYASGGVVQLMPANSKYPPLVYTKDNCDCFRIVGKALKFLSKVL